MFWSDHHKALISLKGSLLLFCYLANRNNYGNPKWPKTGKVYCLEKFNNRQWGKKNSDVFLLSIGTVLVSTVVMTTLVSVRTWTHSDIQWQMYVTMTTVQNHFAHLENCKYFLFQLLYFDALLPAWNMKTTHALPCCWISTSTHTHTCAYIETNATFSLLVALSVTIIKHKL